MKRSTRKQKRILSCNFKNNCRNKKRSKEFIISISNLIQTLNIDHLHIIGDIYDRGPYPHMIMDKLKNYHNVDIQWGNHDMLWIGAALGNEACICYSQLEYHVDTIQMKYCKMHMELICCL